MNSTAAALPAITNAVTVGVSAEQAFRVFTESFHTWWPAGYHIGKVDPDRVIIEPRVGGRWYERGVDGSECDWGHVVSWELSRDPMARSPGVIADRDHARPGSGPHRSRVRRAYAPSASTASACSTVNAPA